MIDPYTISYPDKVKSKVDVLLKDGKTFSQEKDDFYGFNTRPLSWESVIEKFRRLNENYLTGEEQDKLVKLVQNLENESMTDLVNLISKRR